MTDTMGVIRILQVVPTAGRAGTESFVMNCFRNVDRTRFEFIFLALSDEHRDFELEITALGGKVVYAGLTFSKIRELIPNVLSLARILRNTGYDILHCHVSRFCAPVFLASVLAGKRHCIAHSHFSEYERGIGGWLRRFVYDMLFEKIMFKFSDRLCACGENAGTALFGTGHPFIILPNAIDLKRFSSVDEETCAKLGRELNIPDRAEVYGNISRYENPKNMPFVVDVFNEIHKRKPESVLILAGKKGDLYDDTLERVRHYSLEDRVRLLGVREDADVLMNLLDCVIYPSLNEGFPFCAVEAQACGTPVIFSDAVPAQVDFGLGLVRFVSLDRNASEWADVAIDAVQTAHADKDMIALKMEEYDIRHTVGRLEAIYEDLYR